MRRFPSYTLKYILPAMSIVLAPCVLNSDDITKVKTDLVRVTSEIINIEHEMMLLHKDEYASLKSETNALSEFFSHLQLGNLMQNIRHGQFASPFLMTMIMESPDDVVRSIILLREIATQLEKKQKGLIESIKNIGHTHISIREKMEKNADKHEKIRLLSLEQETLLNKKYQLFFKTSLNPNLEKFSNEHKVLREEDTQNFDDLIHQLQSLLNTKAKNTKVKMHLSVPVNGFINPQTPSSDPTKLEDLAVMFDTAAEAQVISPLEGTVVFASYVPSIGHVVILKQEDFFCVLTGLGSVHCFLGDSLFIGEPIGRMPIESNETNRFSLRFELHKGAQNLDPRPYLNITY